MNVVNDGEYFPAAYTFVNKVDRHFTTGNNSCVCFQKHSAELAVHSIHYPIKKAV
jgi:hypothetical protein